MDDFSCMKTLSDVADFYETHNWTQRQFYDGTNDAYCVAGAIARICGHIYKIERNFDDSERFDSAAYQALRDELHKKLKLGAEKDGTLRRIDITIWNDEPGRTKEEVIDALRS